MRQPVILFLAAVLAMCGCSKKEGGGNAPDDPASLGKTIAANHEAMMKELVTILDAKKTPEELRPAIQSLKEKYIKIHVASGKQREKLGEQERKKCDAELQSAMFGMKRDTLKKLQEVTAAIRKEDNDLANELASFNVLTQYAVFELLKKQLPKEAERLGIP
jgi:soluble P-type ATPase